MRLKRRMTTGRRSSSPLPWEALEVIADYLDPKTLAIASCVSREWFSSLSSDHRWEPLCADFPSLSGLRSCFPGTSSQQLYGLGLTASKRRPRPPLPPRISLADLIFAIEIRTKSGAVLTLTEPVDKFSENQIFMFEIEVNAKKFGEVEGGEEVKVTWNVVLGPKTRAAFMMMELEGKVEGWLSSELPGTGCSGGGGGIGSGLSADVKLGLEKVRLGIMNQASLRYMGVDDALRYLQHFLVPHGCCLCAGD